MKLSRKCREIFLKNNIHDILEPYLTMIYPCFRVSNNDVRHRPVRRADRLPSPTDRLVVRSTEIVSRLCLEERFGAVSRRQFYFHTFVVENLKPHGQCRPYGRQVSVPVNREQGQPNANGTILHFHNSFSRILHKTSGISYFYRPSGRPKTRRYFRFVIYIIFFFYTRLHA